MMTYNFRSSATVCARGYNDDDSRPKATNGVGKGVITFKVDERGNPVGFQFNSLAHFHLEPIAIGRLVH
jgi:hypothetical protein